LVIIDPAWIDIFNINKCYSRLPRTKEIIEYERKLKNEHNIRMSAAAFASHHHNNNTSSSTSSSTSMGVGDNIIFNHPIYYVPMHPLTDINGGISKYVPSLSLEWIEAATCVGQSITPKRYPPPQRSIFEDPEQKRMTNDEWLTRLTEIKRSNNHRCGANNVLKCGKLWLLSDDIVCHVGSIWVMIWQLSSGRCLQHWRMNDWERHQLQRSIMSSSTFDQHHPHPQSQSQSQRRLGVPPPPIIPPTHHSIDRRRYWLWNYGHNNCTTFVWDLRFGLCLTPSLIDWPMRGSVSLDGSSLAEIVSQKPSLANDIDLIYHWDEHDIMLVVTRRTCWLYDMANVHHPDDINKHVTPLVLTRFYIAGNHSTRSFHVSLFTLS
jgi:hypothetical protein